MKKRSRLLVSCGRAIRMARREAKLSPEELLDKADFKVSKETVLKLKLFESGELDITFDILTALADALGRNVMISTSSTVKHIDLYFKRSNVSNVE